MANPPVRVVKRSSVVTSGPSHGNGEKSSAWFRARPDQGQGAVYKVDRCHRGFQGHAVQAGGPLRRKPGEVDQLARLRLQQSSGGQDPLGAAGTMARVARRRPSSGSLLGPPCPGPPHRARGGATRKPPAPRPNRKRLPLVEAPCRSKETDPY